jgi:O-antigen ligase
MLILRLCQLVVLWGLVGALTFYAWMTSTAAAAYDSRVAWGFGWALASWISGLVALALLRRINPRRWPRLGGERHALALVVAALCAHALSHVSPDLSVRVLREEAPLFFLPLYPLAAALTPLLLSSGARTRDAARQSLLVVTALVSLSGAIVFMDAPIAAWLGLAALALELGPGRERLPSGTLTLLAGLFVALCAVAAIVGYNPFAARPALQWIVGLAALGAAVALQPRDGRDWRDLLAAAVVPAVVVAVCGALVTVALASIIAVGPALHTRLVLFREHPNFLAPYFGFHAVLAVGLAGAARGARRWGWIASALLLIASTVLTDSRTGIAAMALALALVPGFYLLVALVRRLGVARLALAAAVVLVLAGGGLALMGTERIASRIDRFEASIDFRIDAWRNALLVIRQHPWLGVGPNTFLAIADFPPGSRFYQARDVPHPHNVLLYVGQSAGLPALLVFLAWVLVLLALLWRRVARGDDPVARPLLVATLAALIGLLAADLLDLGLALSSVVPAPLFLLTGLVAARSEPRETEGRPWQLLAWAGGLLAVAVPFAVRPLLALGVANQGLLLTYEADQRLDTGLKRRALQKIEQAIALEPLTPELHGMLARWREQQPYGYPAAHELLESRIALAPHDGQGHSLLAQLCLRLDHYDEAEPELLIALADPQGGAWHSRDRAGLIHCVAELGRRDEAVQLMVDAIERDLGVLAQLPWMDDPQPPHRLEVAGGADRPIELTEIAELLFQRAAASQLAGNPVGRAAWLDLYHTYRIAGRDDRAADVLDWLESNGVADVEDWTIAAQRGELALSAGDAALAKQHFERAVALNPGLPFYRQRLSQAARVLGESAQAVETVSASLLLTGEILDRPTDFRDNLDAKAASQIESGDPGGAAESLRRSLLFHDELLDRAKLWARIGELDHEAGRDDECVAALTQVHALLAAKPFPWADLQIGLTDSLPMQVARTLTDAWRATDPVPRSRLHRAWGLPGFYDSRQGPSLFRLGFYAENGLTDHLLRESELQLLIDPDNVLAHWMKLAALEAAYDRLGELPMAMRAFVESYGRRASPGRQFDQITSRMRDTPALQQDPQMWRDVGLLSLLRGRYSEAIGFFENGRAVETDPAAKARFCGWEALAAHLVGQPAQALERLEAGVALDPHNELLRNQLIVAQGALAQ